MNNWQGEDVARRAELLMVKMTIRVQRDKRLNAFFIRLLIVSADSFDERVATDFFADVESILLLSLISAIETLCISTSWFSVEAHIGDEWGSSVIFELG